VALGDVRRRAAARELGLLINDAGADLFPLLLPLLDLLKKGPSGGSLVQD